MLHHYDIVWPGQPEEGMAEEGGDGDAALQGGGLPGTLHWTGDCQEREILGPPRDPAPGVGTLRCALGMFAL